MEKVKTTSKNISIKLLNLQLNETGTRDAITSAVLEVIRSTRSIEVGLKGKPNIRDLVQQQLLPPSLRIINISLLLINNVDVLINE